MALKYVLLAILFSIYLRQDTVEMLIILYNVFMQSVLHPVEYLLPQEIDSDRILQQKIET